MQTIYNEQIMKKLLVFLFLLLFLLLPACQDKNNGVSSTPKVVIKTTTTNMITPSIAPQKTTKPAIQSNLNPLTGLEVSNPEILNRRPVMIKVSNYPAIGRPHAGLAYADLVFDYYIGVGQNRFLAVFYGQDAASIGPVRSGRLVDIQMTNLYQGILGFGSADGDTLDSIFGNLGRRAISNPEAPCPAFCGSDTHSVIGVFANSAEISYWYSQQAKDNHRYDLSGMKFGDLDGTVSKAGSQVTIKFNYYNRTDWKYDSGSNQYLRWMNDEMQPESFNMIPSTERATGKQLGFSNLIIIFAKYTEFAPSKHDVSLWGNTKGQRAVLFRNGVMIEGTWKTNSRSKPIQFFDSSGNSLPLTRGNSWIVITGLASSFNEGQTGQWELFFALP
jgi:hypothetical protein